jgi:hypothetical protein
MTSSYEFVRLPCPTENSVYAGGGGGTVSLLSSVSQDSPVFVSLFIVLPFGQKVAVPPCAFGTSGVVLVLFRDPRDDDSNVLSLQTT